MVSAIKLPFAVHDAWPAASTSFCLALPFMRFGRYAIWGLPKIRGTLLGFLVIRMIISWGLYSGPPILGNYHMTLGSKLCCFRGRVPSLESTPSPLLGGSEGVIPAGLIKQAT